MKKLLKYFSICLVILVSLFSVSCTKTAKSSDIETNQNVKNMVVLIGDGMGQNHIKNAKVYYGLENQEFEEDFKCEVDTSSKSIGATDSAASATAMATGVSVYNKKVSSNGKKNYQTILEYAKSKGKKTGIITTDQLSGATPACFSSHANERGDTDDIVNGQLESQVDLLVGAGNNVYSQHTSDFLAKGYNVVSTVEDLYNTPKEQKVLATLENIKSIYNTELSSQTDISKIVEFALSYLENKNGFVLMVECAHIDKFSHSNQLKPALAEVRTLFDVATTLYNYDKANNGNTAIIITADHETGNLKYASSKETIETKNNSLYKSGGHTSKNVNLYVHNISFKKDFDVVKNTFIFTISKFVVDNYKVA